MYAVVCRLKYWEEISSFVSSIESQIVFSKIQDEINFVSIIEQIKQLSIEYLIIDVTTIQDQDDFIESIKQFHILNDKIHIIIIAPYYKPGNVLLHHLVSMGIYDILTLEEESTKDNLVLTQLIKRTIESSSSHEKYKNAVKWVMLDVNSEFKAKKGTNVNRSDNRLKSPEIQIQVQTIKELVGTITIAVSSLQHGSGATYNALMIAKFLANRGLRVAVVELKQKNDYSLIYLPRKETYSFYHYRYDKFDIFANDGEATSDELLIAAMSKNYQYLILDTGLIFKYDFNKAALDKPETQIKKFEKGDFYNDFMKSDIKIVNSFASIQFADSIEYLMNYINVWSITDLKILFNFSDQERIKNLKNISESEIFLEPYNPSKALTEEQDQFYGQLLGNMLPLNSSKKKGLQLGKLIKSFTKN